MPYFNKMVAGFDLPGDKSVGYYSGVLGTTHTIGQFTSIYAWGRLSGKLFIVMEQRRH